MSKIKHITYEEEEPGNCAIMLFWQSVDGRQQIKYYDTFNEAQSHAKYLKSLGRLPVMYHQIKSIESEAESDSN